MQKEITWEVRTKLLCKGQIHHFLRQVSLELLLRSSAGRIAKELWWTNQALCLVDIISPWIPMLIYHLGDEQ
jgi:hypothetical protein